MDGPLAPQWNLPIPPPMVANLHIPKTAGTDMREWHVHLHPQLIMAHEHGCDAKHFTLNKTNPNIHVVSFLRDPIYRFISGFKFITDETKEKGILPCCAFKDINDYVGLLRYHIEHRKTMDLTLPYPPSIDYPDGVTIVTEGIVPFEILFKKHIAWLNGDHNRTFLLLYNSNNIYDTYVDFLKTEFDIVFERQTRSETKLNVSNSYDDYNYVLTPENEAFVREYFKEDIALYNALVASGKQWMKYSDLLNTSL